MEMEKEKLLMKFRERIELELKTNGCFSYAENWYIQLRRELSNVDEKEFLEAENGIVWDFLKNKKEQVGG